METCSYCERLLPAFLDGELDGPLRRKVNSHVADCLVCMRETAAIEQAQELVRQTIEEKVNAIDFSAFLDEVMGQLDTVGPTTPSWQLRLQLWWDTWRPRRSGQAFGWASVTSPTGWIGAAASVALIIGGVVLSQTETSQPTIVSVPDHQEIPTPSETDLAQADFARTTRFAPTDPPAYVMGNQAQIESLTASTTVMLWNEPISNATVIWVGDTGGMP